MAMGEEIIYPIPGINTFTYEDVNTMLTLQKLWIDTVILMRNFFRSTMEDHQDLGVISDRLFGTLPLDFYNGFRKYFSEEDSQNFLNLFSQAIYNNRDLANAYKNEDTAAIDAATVKWYRTADDLAAFLSSVNPYWEKEKLEGFLDDYIKLKILEIIAFLKEDYQLESNLFDAIEDKAIEIAAYMATGMIDMRRPLEYHLSPKPDSKFIFSIIGWE